MYIQCTHSSTVFLNLKISFVNFLHITQSYAKVFALIALTTKINIASIFAQTFYYERFTNIWYLYECMYRLPVLGMSPLYPL